MGHIAHLSQYWMHPPFRLLSSTEPEAQVSFSDHNLSLVRRRRCHRLKLFTFSSPESLGQFKLNLAQNNLK